MAMSRMTIIVPRTTPTFKAAVVGIRASRRPRTRRGSRFRTSGLVAPAPRGCRRGRLSERRISGGLLVEVVCGCIRRFAFLLLSPWFWIVISSFSAHGTITPALGTCGRPRLRCMDMGRDFEIGWQRPDNSMVMSPGLAHFGTIKVPPRNCRTISIESLPSYSVTQGLGDVTTREGRTDEGPPSMPHILSCLDEA